MLRPCLTDIVLSRHHTLTICPILVLNLTNMSLYQHGALRELTYSGTVLWKYILTPACSLKNMLTYRKITLEIHPYIWAIQQKYAIIAEYYLKNILRVLGMVR